MRKKNVLILVLAAALLGTAAECSASEELFADMEGWSFSFSSGAGAWATGLTIHEDGSFEGNYHDTNMGDVSDEHPHGDMYVCDFTGKFSEPEQIDDYTYSVRLLELEQETETGVEEIVDQVLYIYSDPYGISGGDEFLIYTPGKPVSELPEAYVDWSRGTRPVQDLAELDFYGLYNVNEEQGFTSYETEDYETPAEEVIIYF